MLACAQPAKVRRSAWRHVVGEGPEGDDAMSPRQAQGSSVGPVAHFLAPGHSGGRQVAEEVVGQERSAEGEPQSQGAGRPGCRCTSRSGSPRNGRSSIFAMTAIPFIAVSISGST